MPPDQHLGSMTTTRVHDGAEKLLRRRRVNVYAALIVGDRIAPFAGHMDGVLADHRLAVATGYIENIGWLTQPRNPAPEPRDQGLPLRYRQAEMTRAGGQI